MPTRVDMRHKAAYPLLHSFFPEPNQAEELVVNPQACRRNGVTLFTMLDARLCVMVKY